MLESLKFILSGYTYGCDTISVKISGQTVSAAIERNFNGKNFESRTFELIGDNADWLEEFDELDIEDWEDSYDNEHEILDGTQWELEYKLEGEEPREIDGDNNYPENWRDFLNWLSIAAPYLKPAPEPEYIYCSVAFSHDDLQTWYYITDDESITLGDYVKVPWGRQNKIRIGIIKDVEIFRESGVPFELAKTKKIFGIASREEFEEETRGNLSYELNKLAKHFEWRQNEFIAERLSDFNYSLKKLGIDGAKYLEMTKGRRLEDAIKNINNMQLNECCAWLSWVSWGENFHAGVFKECLYNGFIDILLQRACALLAKK